MRQWKVIVAISVGALALAGGLAWASIPDASGVIHGCYKTGSGALRVIDTDAGATCLPSETPLNWSQHGPPGPAGATNLIIRTHTETIAPNETEVRTFTAFCLAGEKATGGGWRLVGPTPAGPPPITVDGTVPQSTSPEPSDGQIPVAWKVIGVVNHDTVAHDVTAFAVCASP